MQIMAKDTYYDLEFIKDELVISHNYVHKIYLKGRSLPIDKYDVHDVVAKIPKEVIKEMYNYIKEEL